jgi:hypothetical protein
MERQTEIAGHKEQTQEGNARKEGGDEDDEKKKKRTSRS